MGRPLGPLGRATPVTYPASIYEALAGPPPASSPHAAPPPPHAEASEARELFTVAEVAGMLRVSEMTIYRLFHAGRLRGAVRFGRQIRIPDTAIHEFIDLQ